MKISKIHIILTCSIFLYTFVNAQRSNSLQLIMGFGVGMEHYKDFQNSASYQRKSTLTGRFNALYVKNLGKKTALKTGLGLSIYGIKNYSSGWQWGTEYNMNGVYTPNPTLPHSGEFSSHIFHLEIPILFHYDFTKNRKWNPYAEVGISTNFLAFSQNKVIDEFGKKTTSKTNFIGKKVYVSPSLITNFGFQYEYMPNHFFCVQPSFTINHFGFYQKLSLGIKYLMFNLEFGTRFLLNAK
jgi:hypothetical protein